MKKAVLILAFAQIVFAGAFNVYPSAKRLPDKGHNPNHAIAYLTPDAFDKVVEYYKKSGKLMQDHVMAGVAEIHFDGGDGVLIRDMKPQGTIIVFGQKNK